MILAAALAVALSAFAATRPSPTPFCSCTPTTDHGDQYRDGTKHHRPDPGFEATPLTVAQMLEWANPPGAAEKKVRQTDAPIDEREGDYYALTGYLWAAHIERNDCDWHLELADSADPTAPRVLVEVTNDRWNAPAQRAVYAFMRDRHKSTRPGASVKFRSAPKVAVVGRAFWDGHHYMARDPKRGNQHGGALVGTLWELHPVVRFRSAQ